MGSMRRGQRTFRPSGGSSICKRGAKVERRRREDRGAEGAEGMGCGEGVSPSPLEEWSGEAMPVISYIQSFKYQLPGRQRGGGACPPLDPPRFRPDSDFGLNFDFKLGFKPKLGV